MNRPALIGSLVSLVVLLLTVTYSALDAGARRRSKKYREEAEWMDRTGPVWRHGVLIVSCLSLLGFVVALVVR